MIEPIRASLRGWIELLRSLGAALLEVYRAEAAEIKEDLGKSSVHLAWGVGLMIAAGMVGFWTLAAGIYFLIHVLALWLPLWGAAGVVLLLLVLTVLTLVWLGYRRFQRWENPAELLGRRVRSHRIWMEEELLPEEAKLGADDGGGFDDGASGGDQEVPR